MAAYCDVALPVPLDRAFTYGVNGVVPAVGARVIVPFGGQRLMGVVVRVHDDAPGAGVEVKPVQTVMDAGALLDREQMELAGWIAGYYCAPLGEVLRGMLPLAAEVKRQFTYRITEQGRKVLYEGAARGASRRSRLTAEEQNREYAVLNYLEGGEGAKAGALRSATGAGRGLLEGMVKKKWLVREAVAAERDAKRVRKVAVVSGQWTVDSGQVPWGSAGAGPGEGAGIAGGGRVGCAEAHPNDDKAVVRVGHTTDVSALGRRLPRLNEGQLAVMAELASVGGRLDLRDLRERLRRRGVAEASVGSVVRRGLVTVVEEAEEFWFGFGAATGEADSSASLRNDKQNSLRNDKQNSLRNDKQNSLRNDKQNSLRHDNQDLLRHDNQDSLRHDNQDSLRNDKQKSRKLLAHEHALNEEQMEAVGTIAVAMAQGGFRASAAVWGYGVGEDGGLFCGDAAGAGGGEEARCCWFRRLG